MKNKKTVLKVMIGNKENYFVFFKDPQIHDFIEDGNNTYEITMIKHKQTVTRKPTDEEYEKAEHTQFQPTLIEVEPAETIIYAREIKKV